MANIFYMLNGLTFREGQKLTANWGACYPTAEGKIVATDIEGQTKQSLENVKSILESAGCTMDNVVKTTVLLSDIANFGKMNEVYKGFFSEGNYPARSAFQAAALPQGALVEIEVIALKAE